VATAGLLWLLTGCVTRETEANAPTSLSTDLIGRWRYDSAGAAFYNRRGYFISRFMAPLPSGAILDGPGPRAAPTGHGAAPAAGRTKRRAGRAPRTGAPAQQQNALQPHCPRRTHLRQARQGPGPALLCSLAVDTAHGVISHAQADLAAGRDSPPLPRLLTGLQRRLRTNELPLRAAGRCGVGQWRELHLTRGRAHHGPGTRLWPVQGRNRRLPVPRPHR
jgi:hypothetical protein